MSIFPYKCVRIYFGNFLTNEVPPQPCNSGEVTTHIPMKRLCLQRMQLPHDALLIPRTEEVPTNANDSPYGRDGRDIR